MYWREEETFSDKALRLSNMKSNNASQTLKRLVLKFAIYDSSSQMRTFVTFTTKRKLL